jgi:chemotaxis signal transduction protein
VSPASEILVFQVGPRIYGTPVGAVSRIGGPEGSGPGEAITATALGEPFDRHRGLVVRCEDGERVLVVDQVIGVRSVPEADLRPLPPLAAQCLASSAVTGLAFLDDAPTLLVDLLTLIREQRRPGAGERPPRRPDDA